MRTAPPRRFLIHTGPEPNCSFGLIAPEEVRCGSLCDFTTALMNLQAGTAAQCELGDLPSFGKPQAAQEELNGRNQRGRDAQFMHSQPHQERNQSGFAGHFTANSDRASVPVGRLHRHVDEAHHRRVSGLIESGHTFVEPIHRQRVTGEIVGADAEEIGFAR